MRIHRVLIATIAAAAVATTALAHQATKKPAAPPATAQAPAKKPAAAGAPAKTDAAKKDAAVPQPQLIVETAKGTFTIALFPDTAPTSVDHILKLVNKGFYRSQRVHRVVAGQLVQFGDQQTRDMTLKEWWGKGPKSGSGNPIGVGEISKKHLHAKGAVGLAHPGDPRAADSQIYITTRAMPTLDGKYTVIGQVTSGMDVVAKLQIGDAIKEVTAKGVPGT
jgi:peptidylprolyl isomerase